MRKRIYFILFSILALLQSNQCRVDTSLQSSRFGISIAPKIIKGNLPYPLSLEKDNKNLVKKPIRIKAWDDAAIAHIHKPWVQETRFYICPTIIYWYSGAYHPSANYPSHSLRGPPIAA
jgi:hypothetical protein